MTPPQAPRTLAPWERQAYDTDESWPIFAAFRDQIPPRRGLLVSVKGRPVNPVQVATWHRAHFWGERAAEFDRHLDAIRVGEREALLAQTSRDISAEHMATLAHARAIIGREFEKLAATVEATAGEVLRPRDLIRLTDSVIKLDRLIRGESTENVEMGPDLTGLTDADLALIASKLEGGAK